MITVRYTKAQYMARITELEGYHGQLQQHTEFQSLQIPFA